MQAALFGNVYLVDGKNCIYLAASSEIMFFAVMSDGANPAVESLIKLRNRVIISDPDRAYKGSLCFIELTSEQFRGYIAHPEAGGSQKDFDMELLDTKIGVLNDSDKQELRDIIVDEKTGINRRLKQLVRELDIV